MFPDLNQRTKTVLLSISVMWGQGALVNRDVWQEPRALQRVSALRSGKSKYAMSFLPRSLCTHPAMKKCRDGAGGSTCAG